MFWTKVHGAKIMKYARLWNIFVIKLLLCWGREPGTRLMSNYSNCKVKMHVKRTEQILAVRSAVAAAVLLLYFIEMQRKVALLMHYSDLFYIWQNLERNQQGWKIPRIKRGPSSNIVTEQVDSSAYWGYSSARGTSSRVLLRPADQQKMLNVVPLSFAPSMCLNLG